MRIPQTYHNISLFSSSVNECYIVNSNTTGHSYFNIPALNGITKLATKKPRTIQQNKTKASSKKINNPETKELV